MQSPDKPGGSERPVTPKDSGLATVMGGMVLESPKAMAPSINLMPASPQPVRKDKAGNDGPAIEGQIPPGQDGPIEVDPHCEDSGPFVEALMEGWKNTRKNSDHLAARRTTPSPGSNSPTGPRKFSGSGADRELSPSSAGSDSGSASQGGVRKNPGNKRRNARRRKRPIKPEGQEGETSAHASSIADTAEAKEDMDIDD